MSRNASSMVTAPIKKAVFRPIDHGKDTIFIHDSVKKRWDADETYRPKNLAEYVEKKGWPEILVD